ncbi:phage tail sheath subtilisin-like domain-containing protein [Sphingomonas sp. AOB5]|uniref:phage tail sheath subtilisin-like domain-containing protein n=1 Tax=Sphingomonas sp. AOB5 TaxID=3034017 RepID=UPI0023F97233|nr:phage tail sheath subtilisin-like domain-containing protein [Sphingomonas sp. AOB5]MDF7776868.1 phage tail sheath subtilisin-like domain-containing protein [Sphingomonas sp. AOB5]
MTIAFDSITPRRVPGSRAEFSARRAISGLPPALNKLLVVGYRRAAGTVAALQRRRMVTADQAAEYFGRGSQLHGMVASALLANSSIEIWAMSIDENAGGTAAVWTITLTGPSSAAGELSYMIGGVKVPVVVASGDSATAMATATAAAINASLDLPVTATSAAGVVTVTFRHKGTAGNELDLRQNHFENQALPGGVTSVIASSVVGATNPDLSAVWAALGTEWYPYIALGLNDAANLTTADTELDSRWGAARQIPGRAFIGVTGTLSTCVSFGQTRNGIHTTGIGVKKMPSPPWKLAAAVAAVAGNALAIDPARQQTGLKLTGIVAPIATDRFIDAEREQLLNAGISTVTFTSSGDVEIERLISFRQVNSFSAPDRNWLDITRTSTLGYLSYSWREMMARKFPRSKNTAGTRDSGRFETIALARDWEEAELIENIDTFIAGFVIEQDATDPTQCNLLLTPDLVDPLFNWAARFEFIG